MGRGEDQVFRDLLGLQENIYRLFDEQTAPGQGNRETVSARWTPPVDIYETPEAFELLAEVPGVSQEEIGLEISGDLLVLRGERPLNTRDPGLSYHRIECPNGIFQRAFRLPEGVEPSLVAAAYRDGVLHVTLPKREEARARSVAVDVEE